MPISAGSRYHDELISTAVRAAAPYPPSPGRASARMLGRTDMPVFARAARAAGDSIGSGAAHVFAGARRSRLQAPAC
jgi:hypothetical protein